LSLALPTEVSHYVGVDWGSESHAVCVMSGDGRVMTRFVIAHTVDGFRQLHSRLASFGDPAEIPVGIERPDGRLVDALLEAGHPVVPVKPHAIKQWRDGEVLSGAKSDAGDAEVIAEYLRLRAHRLRVATPYSGETKALRAVVRTRDDLVEMRVAATNQLAALLDTHWPGAKAIFANIESPIALHFLARYPTPEALAGASLTDAADSRMLSAWRASPPDRLSSVARPSSVSALRPPRPRSVSASARDTIDRRASSESGSSP